MFRLWAKTFKDNHMLCDIVIEDDTQDTRTHKVYNALEKVCYAFDLGKPIWLEKTIREFKRHDKARFTQDNFMETVDFDYLEIHVIEEDQTVPLRGGFFIAKTFDFFPLMVQY